MCSSRGDRAGWSSRCPRALYRVILSATSQRAFRIFASEATESAERDCCSVRCSPVVAFWIMEEKKKKAIRIVMRPDARAAGYPGFRKVNGRTFSLFGVPKDNGRGIFTAKISHSPRLQVCVRGTLKRILFCATMLISSTVRK